MLSKGTGEAAVYLLIPFWLVVIWLHNGHKAFFPSFSESRFASLILRKKRNSGG